ncbi:serine/threonine protein kinase [Pseudobutyrivibrio sp.]|uniref:serine/threonine protein kinase n=1 Tax=Pseudobutyrivibrio sp. TaxID=2014367 RepID=UPI001E113E0E|nr:serine/threonine-protein kinase [Pseudobutyrivibrio sp.]MBE5912002.1 serine/threonine protein kinase [Pseudobutyrivibrio sp.]
MNINKLCMGCMNEVDNNQDICPKCGYKHGAQNSARGLQPQTILNGKYLVGKVIGEGGFGITYIAYDLVLNNRVAIKEYFPSELVTRDTSNGIQTYLTVLTGNKEEQYKKGIDRFVREAGNLAKFNNLPGIVSVKEFFYENNTAYMVMEYIDGETLSKYLDDNGGKLPYSKVLEMMSPVMDSLEKVHEAGIIHRDISPDNIIVARDGSMKLIDFGAARLVDNNDEKSLTVILKHGYAPEEQYHPDGKQGPWTDIYALSATMYRMITGIVPQESTDRVLNKDALEPLNKLKTDVPKNISDAIMQGLAVKASQRPQRVADFEENLRKGYQKKLSILYIGVVAVIILIVAVATIKNSEKQSMYEAAKKEMIDTESQAVEELDDSEELESAADDTEMITQIEAPEPEIVEKTEEELIEMVERASALVVYNNVYCDFDNDGARELLAITYGENQETVDYGWYTGVMTVWYANEAGANKVSDITVSSLYSSPGNNSLENVDLETSLKGICNLRPIQFGRNNMCEVGYYSDPTDMYENVLIFVVDGTEPHLDDLSSSIGLINAAPVPSIMKSSVYEFYSDDMEVYHYGGFGQNIGQGYPVYYVGGKWGELCSVEITYNEFSKIKTAEAVMADAEKQILELDYMLSGQDGINVVCKSATLEEVLYNDSNMFYLNYLVSIDLGGQEHANIIYDDNWEQIDLSPHYIDKTNAYVAVKYENGQMIIVDIGFGKQLADHPDIENVATSEFVSERFY